VQTLQNCALLAADKGNLPWLQHLVEKKSVSPSFALILVRNAASHVRVAHGLRLSVVCSPACWCQSEDQYLLAQISGLAFEVRASRRSCSSTLLLAQRLMKHPYNVSFDDRLVASEFNFRMSHNVRHCLSENQRLTLGFAGSTIHS
jgi:hypothetical protein